MKRKDLIADLIAIGLLFIPGTLLGIWSPLSVIESLLYFVSGVLTFIVTQQIFEIGISLGTKNLEFAPLTKKHTITAILPMYLPNEQNIMYDTLNYFKTLHIQTILAYNTPVRMHAVETAMQEYELENSDWLTIVSVPNSRSKSHNINYVLENYELGDMVCFFDADARPMITNFDRATYWLFDQNYDYVQGKCKIRPTSNAIFQNCVSMNFAVMYSVCHKFRDSAFGYALFGGSNGYWKREAIKYLKFDPEMLTEDIDCAVRALYAGYKGKYDDEIVSSEEAPNGLWDLIVQRTRWAQGWFEVSIKHFAKFFKMPVSFGAKLGILNLFILRELLCHVKLLALPLIVARYIRFGPVTDYFGGAVLFYSFLPYILQLVAGLIADKDQYWDAKWKVFALIAALIFYTFFESFIIMRAHIRYFMSQNEWITTPRAK